MRKYDEDGRRTEFDPGLGTGSIVKGCKKSKRFSKKLSPSKRGRATLINNYRHRKKCRRLVTVTIALTTTTATTTTATMTRTTRQQRQREQLQRQQLQRQQQQGQQRQQRKRQQQEKQQRQRQQRQQ